MRITKLRPSPAMVVAIVALVFAMTGVGAAAILSNPLPLQNSAPPPTEYTVIRDATGTAVAHCNPGDLAVGGGFLGPLGGTTVTSAPVTGSAISTGQAPDGWEAGTNSGGVEAYAVCQHYGP